jgi:small subunit ribosomal protein S17
MADEEKNETTEEAAEPEAEPAAESQEPAAPEVSQVPESELAAEPGAESQELSLPEANSVPASDAAPEEAPEVEAEGETPAPVKPSRSRRHVPRSLRRTRTQVKREAPAKRKPITRLEKPESEPGRRQERRGVVVSDKGDKTIVVKVDVIKSHPRYKKVVRRSVKFHAHDEANQAGVGDRVRIVETRPLSKTKHWRLAEIVEKAK